MSEPTHPKIKRATIRIHRVRLIAASSGTATAARTPVAAARTVSISELRKARAGRADKNVTAWAASTPTGGMFVSVITVQELEIGVLLAERRDPSQGALLRRWLEERVLPAFAERIIPVDVAVARQGALLHVPDPLPVRDALIASSPRPYWASRGGVA